MFSILITGHNPPINAKDVPLDTTIEIYLDKEIDLGSISQNNIVVTDQLYKPVPGVISHKTVDQGTPNGVNTILTFTPTGLYDIETTYNVTVSRYPDSVRALDSSFIQQLYKFTFMTGNTTSSIPTPTPDEQLKIDLQVAIDQQNWCEAGRIQAIIDGESEACDIPIPSGIPGPEYLILTNHYPEHMQSNIPFDELRFIKLDFNDSFKGLGVDFGSYITVTTKNVLE